MNIIYKIIGGQYAQSLNYLPKKTYLIPLEKANGNRD